MRPRPRLIAELVSLTRPWGWTLPDLAREIHVSLASLNQYRSGRRPLSMETFSRIAERFGDYRIIRDAAWEYARAFHAPVVAAPPDSAHDLPIATARALARFVERFPEELLRGGQGLFLTARDPRLLIAAVAHLRALFATAQVPVALVRADRTLSASDLRDALAAPLVVVERVEFLHPTVADLLRRRDEIVRPTVVTSVAQVDASDADLTRIFRTRMRPLVIPSVPPRNGTPAAHPSHPLSHAAA